MTNLNVGVCKKIYYPTAKQHDKFAKNMVYVIIPIRVRIIVSM